jgi:PAS domain S-box-containing protein
MGVALADTSGEGWLSVVHPLDRDRVVAEWNQAASERLSFLAECRFQRPDGTVPWVTIEAFPLRTGGDGSIGYMGIVRDITARKLALEALQDSEHRYRNLVDVSPQALLVHANGLLLFSNPAGARLLGAASPQDVVGRNLADWFLADSLRPTNIPANGDGSAETFAQSLLRPDGTAIDVEIYAVPITFDGKAAVQFILRKLSQQNETAARSHHAKKVEAIATLSGGIAHEFNNCLTAILGFTELALLATPAPSKPRGHLQQVILASKRARDMVNQMLLVSRQGATVKQPITLHCLLKETLRLFRLGLPEQIAVHEWIQGSTRPVLADPTQIHQVFVTVLANAEQALNGAGGVLEVRLEDVPIGAAATDGLSPMVQGNYVRFAVSGSKGGMNRAADARLVDPLLTVKGIREGVGMELSIVERIVADHRGAIHMTSQAGHGRIIELFLPAVSAPMATEPGLESHKPTAET